MLIMFCSWKRLSQRVYNIQIRMYLANLYVSLLDLTADGIEASLDVLGSLVKSGFLCQGNCTSIVTKDFHWTRCTRYDTKIFNGPELNSFVQTPSFGASEAAMYSASHVDPATTLYLELHQLIAPPFNKIRIRFVT